MRPALRSFLLFAVAWVPASVVLFLWLSGFLTTWSGQAVSVRTADPVLAKLQVLVVEEDGRYFEDFWPREALTGTDLAIDRTGLPPKPLPEGLPSTVKERFTLSFTVTPEGGVARDISTASPQTLGMALFALFGGLLIRNMLVAGNPFSIEPRGVELVKRQVGHGQIAPTANSGGGGNKENRASRRSRKGPPPPKKRRGGGRRR